MITNNTTLLNACQNFLYHCSYLKRRRKKTKKQNKTTFPRNKQPEKPVRFPGVRVPGGGDDGRPGGQTDRTSHSAARALAGDLPLAGEVWGPSNTRFCFISWVWC